MMFRTRTVNCSSEANQIRSLMSVQFGKVKHDVLFRHVMEIRTSMSLFQ